MLDLIIDIDDISVSTNSTLLASNSSDVDVVTIEPLVQVHDNQFVLSSGNYSSGNGLVGSVPNWLLTVIQQQLTSGDGNVMSVLSSMNEALDALRLGVAQSIASLNAVSLSQSSLLTALRSDVNANNASILNVLATKVDTAAATAIATNAIQSKFGTDVNAFVGNIASTYVDANSSIAQNMNLLNTTLNGVNTNVSDIATLTTESVPNTLWVDDGNQLDPDTNGNSRYIIQAKAKKQLAIDANGVVTSLLLDSGSAIAITMQADQFKIVASGQSVDSENPFTVDATSGNISFNGIVDFTSTNALGNTTIDGSKITTGSINAAQIAAGTITTNNLATGITLVNGQISSSNFTAIGGDGFRLKSNASGTAADPTIYGAYIKGGAIDGSKFIGALQAMQIFNNDSTVAPSIDTNNPNVVASFTMPAPIAGTSHRLYINMFCYANNGDGKCYIDIRVNGTSIEGNFVSMDVSTNARFYRSYITNSSYSTSASIQIYSWQGNDVLGNSSISSLNINISALGII
jgi:hypothetical protein